MTEPTPPAEMQERPAERPPLWRLFLYAAPFAVFAALGAVLAQQVLLGGAAKTTRSALIGAPAPALDLPKLSGEGRVDRTALTGEGGVVVVNFWASWCAPCIEEHPSLIALSKKKGVTLFGVLYNDKPANGKRFLGRLGDPFKAVGVDPRGYAAVEWGVRGVPETFILSSRGKVIYKHSGPIRSVELEKIILPAIEKARLDEASRGR